MNTNVIIRPYKPGEPSLVVHFYYKLFEQQFHFLPNVENYFLHAMTELFENPEGNGLWIAEENGRIAGSICIVGKGKGNAQLRLFGTAPSLQGKGAGKMLMQTAMDFCEKRGYTHIILWTIDICKAARHMYGKFGFELTDTKLNTTWADYEMTEEKWEYFGKYSKN